MQMEVQKQEFVLKRQRDAEESDENDESSLTPHNATQVLKLTRTNFLSSALRIVQAEDECVNEALLEQIPPQDFRSVVAHV
ncbi:hypothetical protein BC936DRAFT_143703 [Jimgerdemannia flammicorona]|uniref:Uncharacterized protein n=1 Tax=Jimgerdemannia flammicorona TaxID=994334 RepID=A0A433DMB7_9FUNG|nr:hypothetical protein BC936DRAFT_143703 [Jimgerdemannia flammicorona]